MKTYILAALLVVALLGLGHSANAAEAKTPSSGDSLRSFATESHSAVVGIHSEGMYGVLGGSRVPLSNGSSVNAGVFGRIPRGFGWAGYFEGGLSVHEDDPAGIGLCRFKRGTDGVIVWVIGPNGDGTISISGATVSYNAFTGSHYGWTREKIERGALVRLTGENRQTGDRADSEVIYGVVRTTNANVSRCFGAYLGLLEPSKPVSPTNSHLIMAVGNGDMWVSDGGNGDLESGNYLISSGVPGCAMKDDPGRFPIGYICARAAESVEWSAVRPDSGGVRRKKISVLFESFERHSGSPALAAKVQAQQAEIESLRAALNSLHVLEDRLAKLEELVVQPASLGTQRVLQTKDAR